MKRLLNIHNTIEYLKLIKGDRIDFTLSEKTEIAYNFYELLKPESVEYEIKPNLMAYISFLLYSIEKNDHQDIYFIGHLMVKTGIADYYADKLWSIKRKEVYLEISSRFNEEDKKIFARMNEEDELIRFVALLKDKMTSSIIILMKHLYSVYAIYEMHLGYLERKSLIDDPNVIITHKLSDIKLDIVTKQVEEVFKL